MKRIFDIIFSVFAAAVFSPVMIAVAAAIWMTEGAPILFRQTRMGQYGRPFKLLKFRSMVENAQEIGGISTAQGDARVTSIGRFIRRWSVDELPQLFNVLRGDMSVVGPRPDVAEQVCNYSIKDWEQRCSVRPGITGLAQAALRSNATPSQRLELDLAYAKNPTVVRDILIIARTILSLFTKSTT